MTRIWMMIQSMKLMMIWDMIRLMLHLLNDDEVELTDEESSNDKDEVAETYKDYKDDWIYEWNKDIPWVDEKPWTNAGVWTKPIPVKQLASLLTIKLDVRNGQHVVGRMMDTVMEETYLKLTLLETNSIIRIMSDT
ncbi:hypothetical protein Tco_0225503, partial [Tanacetum coccineum]